MILYLSIVALYILFYVVINTMLYLNIITLKELRKSLNAKDRKSIDRDVAYIGNCKKFSIFWPYTLYMLMKFKNEKE